MIYQRGASDAPGEFRRAGVNEASNDNLAARRKTVRRRRGENGECFEGIRVCSSFSFPPSISLVAIVPSARFSRFSGELEHSTVANYVTTAMIIRREGEKKERRARRKEGKIGNNLLSLFFFKQQRKKCGTSLFLLFFKRGEGERRERYGEDAEDKSDET